MPMAQVRIEHGDGSVTNEEWPAEFVYGVWQLRAPREVFAARMHVKYPPVAIGQCELEAEDEVARGLP